MPRNAQGIYNLPVGNPVLIDTLIESIWANDTLSDLANEITASLPRNGSAAMSGPLILAGDATVPLQAVTKQQLDAVDQGGITVTPQTNTYDETTGRAGIVGYFGIGASDLKDIDEDDLNNNFPPLVNGFYHMTGTWNDNPIPWWVNGNCNFLVLMNDTSWGSQLALHEDGSIYSRGYQGGIYWNWLRTMMEGDFGIGRTTGIDVFKDDGLDIITQSGLTSVSSSNVQDVNGPPDSSEHGTVITNCYSALSAYQIYQENGTDRYGANTYWRSKENDVWTEWRMAYDQWNVVGTVSDNASGIPNGAVVDRGGDAVNWYVKWADGTLIQGGVVNIPNVSLPVGALYRATTDTTWTFLLPFIDDAYHLTGSDSASTHIMTICAKLTVLACSVNAWSTASVATARAQTVMAVGRWK